jgi:hypothetical protein
MKRANLLLTAGQRADDCSGRATPANTIKISFFNTVEKDASAGTTEIVRALFLA